MPSWLHCMAHVTQHGRRHYLHLFLLLTLIQASRKIPIKILKSNKPFIPRAAKKGQPQIFRSTSLLKKWTSFHPSTCMYTDMCRWVETGPCSPIGLEDHPRVLFVGRRVHENVCPS